MKQVSRGKFFYKAAIVTVIFGLIIFIIAAMKWTLDLRVKYFACAIIVAILNIIIGTRVDNKKDLKEEGRAKKHKRKFYEESRSGFANFLFEVAYFVFNLAVIYSMLCLIPFFEERFDIKMLVAFFILLATKSSIRFGIALVIYIIALLVAGSADDRFSKELKEYKEKWEKENRESNINKVEE